MSRQFRLGSAALAAAAAGSIVRCVHSVYEARTVVPLHEAHEDQVSPPKVSIIVPARNEAAVLDDCLRAIRGQTYAAGDESALRIVVVDDGSTDGTGDIARAHAAEDRRMCVIAVDGPPAGWSGKVHAMHIGVEATRPPEPGEWLLFVDADVVLAPELLARLIATAEAVEADLVSTPGGPPPTHSASWAVLMPAGMQMIAENAAPDGRGRKAFAIGHCILMRRSHYEKVGGWSALWRARNEDVAMATAVRDSGGATRLVDGEGQITTTGMDPFSKGWASFRKSFVAGTRGSALVLGALGAGQIALSLAPPVAVAAGLRGRRPLLTAVGLLGWAAQGIAHTRAARVAHASTALAPIAPLTGSVFGVVLLDGAVRTAGGMVAWKGRTTQF